jgi:hypothetical protein
MFNSASWYLIQKESQLFSALCFVSRSINASAKQWHTLETCFVAYQRHPCGFVRFFLLFCMYIWIIYFSNIQFDDKFFIFL